MQIKKIAIISIIVILVLGILLISMFHIKVSPETVAILSMEVSDESINLKGSFAGSSIFYSSYKIKYTGSNLYITLMASTPFQLPGSQKDPFVISIPNKYGPIKKIYLKGNKNASDKLIWSEKEA